MKITSLDIPSLETENLEEAAKSQHAVTTIREELPDQLPVEELIPGLKAWRNPINRFRVLRLHRTADPLKRSAEWIAKTRAGMDTASWLQEYELVWEALDGRPVYVDEWSYEFHVSKLSLGWNPSLAICRGWDFGLYPACIFVQLFPHSRLIVLRECVGIDIDTERFIVEVDRFSKEWFPDAKFLEFVDPTGKNRAGTDGRSYTKLLTAKPLRAKNIRLGLNAPVARRSAVTEFLSANVKGLPCLLIDPSCEVLIKGFNGGYVYKYFKGTLKTKPEKNLWSHIHDGLQYVCSRIRTVDTKATDNKIIPIEPRFGSGRKPIIPESPQQAGL